MGVQNRNADWQTNEIRTYWKGCYIPTKGRLEGSLRVQSDISQTIDNGMTDAFGRSRVSQPSNIFDYKQIGSDNSLYFDDQEVSGSGTNSVYSADRASTTMSVSNVTAGLRVRQSFRRYNYLPGKSQIMFFTGVMGATGVGITKRGGYFDEDNGLFFENDAGTVYCVIRSNVTGTPVDTRIAQSQWNLDKLDGSGASGITLDVTKTQIYVIDFEWLGVGAIRFGVIVNGKFVYVHKQQNANVLDSVYMSTPNLPIRYEIENDGTGAADSIEVICSSVSSEGGQDANGLGFSVERGASSITTLNNSNIYPLLSVRLKATDLGSTIQPISTDILILGGANRDFQWFLFIDPTIAGVDAVSWVNKSNTGIQYDISRDNTNVLSGGVMLASGYGSGAVGGVSLPVNIVDTIGAAIDGTRQEFVLGARRLTSGTDSFLASMNFLEFS